MESAHGTNFQNRMYRKRKPRLLLGVSLILLFFGTVSVFKHTKADLEPSNDGGDTFTGRKLLQDEPQNCTPRSIDQFPQDFMTLEQRQQGGIVFHIFVVIYIFAALAVVCDDYFVSSLENLCNALKLQPDVAGATFMAAGSSAPELFTSVIGVFFAKSDVGLGTIVGSAVFNVLCIIALCGLFAGMVVYLTWWPMFRDCVFYLISVLTLALVMYDNLVTWYEALVMVLLYVIYIIIMKFNPVLGNFMIEKVEHLKEKCCCDFEHHDHEQISKSEKSPLLADVPSVGQKYLSDNGHLSVPRDVDEKGHSGKFSNISYGSHHSKASVYSDRVGFERSGPALNLHGSGEHSEDEDEYVSPLTFPETTLKRIFWIVMFPAILLFFITIPDCRRPGCWQKTYMVTFLMAVLWIAGMSYIMVWMVTIAGDTFNIPDTVMGLTFLAAGTSVPDAMAGIFVARDGYGDMAISNSIGSNVFDILICLGLPWVLETAISKGQPLEIESRGLIFTVLVLFGTVLFLVVAMFLNRWRLNKRLGIICLLVYALVVVFSCLYEMNVFIDVNLPTCPRDI